MMPDLSKIYDAAFFAEWGPANAAYLHTARLIAKTLAQEFRPKRIADLGCGCGVYAHAFAAQGIEALALDGVKPPPEHSFPVKIETRDLTVPFDNVWGDFDFALCLEVAEHIPQEKAGVFLDNLLKFSGTLVLSAAPPNQGGHHHVNEQPRRYWAGLLAAKGYDYRRQRTGRLLQALSEQKPDYMWMVNHIAVYEKTPSSRKAKPFATPANS